MKYWIAVVSKDHATRGVKDGIMQIGHGKRASLARLKKHDWLIYYSPVHHFADKKPLQAFTALGQVADDDIYQEPMRDDFNPYRRRAKYIKVKDTPIRPLIEKLSFIKSKQAWGYVFRFGLLEIPENDFILIKNEMSKNKID
jgi:predicted RNA-binding protein